MKSLTIVTGASSNHFKSLLNLIRSIRVHCSDVDLIVYDLGLTNTEREQLPNPRIFLYEEYPAFFNINIEAGQYAWKPAIIHEVCSEKPNNPVLWLDAGCLVTNTLTQFERTLKTEGLYSPTSSGNIHHWTHPTTLRLMRVSKKVKTMPNRTAGVIGVYSTDARKLMKKWCDYSHCRSIIAPKGSNRLNHRQDQAVLSVLINQHKTFKNNITQHLFSCISIHNDVDDPS